MTGIEPAISGLTGRRDNQLRYTPVTMETMHFLSVFVNTLFVKFIGLLTSQAKAIIIIKVPKEGTVNEKRLLVWLLALIAVSTIATLAVYASLPQEAATKWTAEGEVLSSGPRYLLIITSLLPLAAVALISQSPMIRPGGAGYQKHARAYGVVISVFIIFLLGMHWVMVLFNLGFMVYTSQVVKLVIGSGFIAAGYGIPKIPYLYSMGIRTPWSLQSEKVWQKTHRLGGLLALLTGTVFLIGIFIEGRVPFLISTGTLIVSVVVIYLYSYMQSRRFV